MVRTSGIYEIENVVNGKRYIGSAVDLLKRWDGHRFHLTRGTHANRHLCSAWVKHGASSFKFNLLLICAPTHLLLYEQRAIDACKPEYNICLTAGSNLGVKRSDETCARISAGKTGQRMSAEVCAQMSASRRGRKLSDKTRLNMSIAQKGRTLSPEHRKKLSGPKSSEARAKMSASATGRKWSIEDKAKMSETRKGRPGIKPSAETRAKMTASQKMRWISRHERSVLLLR